MDENGVADRRNPRNAAPLGGHSWKVTHQSYLLKQVTLLRIHRFDPADIQFGDAVVSSAVVWFRKTPPPRRHCPPAPSPCPGDAH